MTQEKEKDGLARVPTRIIQRLLAISKAATQAPWDLRLTEDGEWRVDFRGKFHFGNQIQHGFSMFVDQADALHIAAAQPAILAPLMAELLLARGEPLEEKKSSIILPGGG